MTLPVLTPARSKAAGERVRTLIWTPSPAHAQGLSKDLAAAGFVSFATDAQSVVGVFAEDVEELAKLLGASLHLEDQRKSKALAFTEETPNLTDFAGIETVEAFVHHHSSRWLVTLVEERRYKSFMQPIVGASDQHIHGYEFLLRGLDPDGEIVPPVDMFEAASNNDIAALLDSVARDSAVRTAAGFGLSERLFINVLPASVSVGHSAFTDTLDLIEASGIRPEQVVFEIVESEAVDDIETLAEVIDFCRSAGYSIALDDFGSGFSNMNMLVGLSPDYIKLDKSLISRVAAEPPIWTITANLIDSAKQSNVKIIAEGVEDGKTARLLDALGADYLQGFYFGRPIDRPIRTR